MTCKCKGTGRRDGFSEYLDCMEPGCNAATERAEFNQRLKQAGSMSVEDAAWWGRQDATQGWISVTEQLPANYTEVFVWPYPTDYCMTAEFWGLNASGNPVFKYGEYTKGWGHEVIEATYPISHWMPLPDHPA